MTGPSSAPRGEHVPKAGATWDRPRVETVIPDDAPDPRPNREERRALARASTKDQPMTYHYTDPAGHQLTVQPDTDLDGQHVVTIWARGEYATVPVRIPVDRIEELVAGIRDTARHAATGDTDHRHAAALHFFGSSNIPEQP